MLVALGRVDAVVARTFPPVEVVFRGIRDRAVACRTVRCADDRARVSEQLEAVIAHVSDRLTTSDANRRASVGLDVDPIAPRALQDDGGARRIDLDVSLVRVASQTDDDAPHANTHLRGIRGHLQQIELGVGAKARVRARSQLNLGARARPRIKGVPGDEWCVHGDAGPILAIVESVRRGAIDQADTGDPWGIIGGHGQ
ncbi:MAG: hypothetical protein P8R42_25605 [Candidatus Binatia bacterium]|nr:hypothetical protein [Candidatus Binatia bacterium]